MSIGREIQGLVNCSLALTDGKTLPPDRPQTQEEIKQKLTAIIENKMPKLKNVMQLTLSDVFDLSSLSDCVKVLFMLSRENLYRYNETYKVEVTEWDNILDNTTVDVNTATIQEIQNYKDSIFNKNG